jgi:hypothetical protein
LVIPEQTQSVTVVIRWGDICEQIFDQETDSCENVDASQIQTLNLGIDTNNDNIFTEVGVQELQVSISAMNITSQALCRDGDSATGVCNLRAFPGDEKVFIEDVRAGCSFPNVGGSTIEAVRIFREEVTDGVSDLPTALSPFSDLPLGANNGGGCNGTQSVPLTRNTVDGLPNGTRFRFSAGVTDRANNVGGLIQMAADAAAVEEDNAADTCFSTDPSFPFNCHVATPQDVFGLIEKEFDCFITTATYGSPFRPQVQDFRQFRNHFLHPTWVGRQVIRFYYWVSPPIAQWIRTHEWSKPIMRVILYPLWLFAKACLQFPFSILSLLLLGLGGVVWRRQQRRPQV